MIGKLVRNKVCLASSLIPLFSGGDNPHDNIEGYKKNKVFQSDKETGLQRLQILFTATKDDQLHPDFVTIIQNITVGFFGGGLYGGITKSRDTFINFIERNEATMFRNHMDAKRQLSDKMYLSFIQGFTKWGLKVSFFCTTFTVTHTCLSVYRNKRSLWHYSVGGMCAGFVYKFPLGPRGMVSGSFFGAIFGTLYGSMKLLLLKVSNLTEEQLLKHRVEVKNMTEEYGLELAKKREMKEVEEEFKKILGPLEK